MFRFKKTRKVLSFMLTVFNNTKSWATKWYTNGTKKNNSIPLPKTDTWHYITLPDFEWNANLLLLKFEPLRGGNRIH